MADDNSTPKRYRVYIHYRPNGSPFYVGKATGNRRPYSFTTRTAVHKNIVAKYGAENIVVSVLCMDTEESALSREVELIAQFKAEGHHLANLTPGGECGSSGLVHTEEARRKIALAATGRAHTPEAKQKIGDAQRGKVISEEARREMSERAKGKKHTDATRALISAASTGRKHTDEARKKISIGLTGKVPSAETRAKWSAQRKGRKASPETRAKISAIHKGHQYNVGRKASQRERDIVSARFKGVPKSAEQRAKMSASNYRFHQNRRAALAAANQLI